MVNRTPSQPFVPDPPEPALGDDRFSRKFKNWREWNVAVNFLTNLHIGVDDSKVLCCPDDPPDVLFQDARFEVKEILDKERRRHDEVKARLNQAITSKTAKRPLRDDRYPCAVDLTPEDAGLLILGELQSLSRYPQHVRAETDLLFYINKLHHGFEEGLVPAAQKFAPYGWRSVSAVIDSQTSIVFSAADQAPHFLQVNLGRARQRFERLTDW